MISGLEYYTKVPTVKEAQVPNKIGSFTFEVTVEV